MQYKDFFIIYLNRLKIIYGYWVYFKTAKVKPTLYNLLKAFFCYLQLTNKLPQKRYFRNVSQIIQKNKNNQAGFLYMVPNWMWLVEQRIQLNKQLSKIAVVVYLNLQGMWRTIQHHCAYKT